MGVNDRTSWLFKASDALFPSVYLPKHDGSTTESRGDFVSARIKEAVRVKADNNLDIPILPYTAYR